MFSHYMSLIEFKNWRNLCFLSNHNANILHKGLNLIRYQIKMNDTHLQASATISMEIWWSVIQNYFLLELTITIKLLLTCLKLLFETHILIGPWRPNDQGPVRLDVQHRSSAAMEPIFSLSMFTETLMHFWCSRRSAKVPEASLARDSYRILQ